MPDTKISDETAASALTGTEIVPVVQGGANRRTTTQDIADLAAGPSTPTSASTGLTTWRNQESATVSDTGAGVAISSPSGNNWIIREKASPATPYTITAKVALTSAALSNAQTVAIGWDDGTKLHLIMVQFENASPGIQMFVAKYTNVSTFSANDFTSTGPCPNPCWLQIEDDGTTIYFRWSADGVNFVTVFSVAKASGFLAGSYTNVCFTIVPKNAQTIGTLMSWTQA